MFRFCRIYIYTWDLFYQWSATLTVSCLSLHLLENSIVTFIVPSQIWLLYLLLKKKWKCIQAYKQKMKWECMQFCEWKTKHAWICVCIEFPFGDKMYKNKYIYLFDFFSEKTFNVAANVTNGWIKFNVNQTGFYRVLYPDSIWRSFSQQLQLDPTVCTISYHVILKYRYVFI